MIAPLVTMQQAILVVLALILGSIIGLGLAAALEYRRDAKLWRRFNRTCEGGGLKVLEAVEAQQRITR